MHHGAPTVAAADPDLRAAIARNARATRRQAILDRIDPGRRMPPEQAAAEVDRIWREELAANGRLGSAAIARNAAALKDLRRRRDELIADLEGHRNQVCASLDALIEQVSAIGAGR